MGTSELNTSFGDRLDVYGGFIDVVGTKRGFFHAEQIDNLSHPVTSMSQAAVTFAYNGNQEALPARTCQSLALVHTGGCGVVIRSATLSTCGWLPETTTLRIVGTSAANLVVCQDPINTQPHEVWSLPATKLSLHQQRWLHHWLELARPGYLQDVIAQDTKWTIGNFPYLLTENIQVTYGTTLTIGSGVMLSEIIINYKFLVICAVG